MVNFIETANKYQKTKDDPYWLQYCGFCHERLNMITRYKFQCIFCEAGKGFYYG